jgi:hypothetical protein
MADTIFTVQIQPLTVSARDDANRKTIIRKAHVSLSRVAPDPTVYLMIAGSGSSGTPRRFKLARNIRSVFHKFLSEGKATIELVAPSVHIIFSMPAADELWDDEQELRVRSATIASLCRLISVAKQLKRDPGLEAKVNVDISSAAAEEEEEEEAAGFVLPEDQAAGSEVSAQQAYADAVQ